MKALLSKGLYGGAAVLLSLSLPLFTACSSDNSAESTNGESGGIATGAATSGHFFLDAAADDGTEYILQNTSVTDGDLNISSNIKCPPRPIHGCSRTAMPWACRISSSMPDWAIA